MTSLGDSIPMENVYSPQELYSPRSSAEPAVSGAAVHSSSSTSSAVSHSELSSQAPPAHHSSSATSWEPTEPRNLEALKSGEQEVVMSGERIRFRTHELPPSPPLTRESTGESAPRQATPPIISDPVETEAEHVEEADLADGWHPLANETSRSLQDNEEVEVGSSAHGRDGVHFDEGEEMAEKPRRVKRTSSQVEQLRLEFKPPSPQSWDAADPDPMPGSHDQLASDYYSTLNSKNFGTLQKTRRRPLVPHSSYYFGPPPPDAAYGTPPVGQIGVHHPREIVRVERDYASGELIQFSPIYPLELEGRITPTQFHETINDINEILISAHSLGHSFIYNLLAVVTLQLSTFVMPSHYTKEMRRLEHRIDELNTQLYNPAGLNILWPRNVAFLFLEIEYY